ncbi:MAG: DUF433 domain-containing protein [bacterium]|nr:DUF433 domain-containing protein [bacterium]
MNFNKISIDPEICHGKPCIKDTRILISVILALIEEGLSFSEIKEEYPELTGEDITEAIRYARFFMENEEIHLLEAVG